VLAASRAWLAMGTAFAVGACVAWFIPREALDWQPQLALRQPWRLWSAALVHFSPTHLVANLLGSAVVVAFGIAARLPRRAAIAWLVAWPLGHAALSLQPQLLHYGGLSGVLHAGVAVAALHLTQRERGHRRAIGSAVLAGLVIKIVFEQPLAGPTQALPGWDFRIAPLAHLTGAAAGLLCGAVAEAIAGPRSGGTTIAR
jgi:rhomboid family GlyGly-CTERM serine protease